MRAILADTTPTIRVLWGLLLLAALVSLAFGRWSLGFVSLATWGLSLAPVVLASRFEIRLPVAFLYATTAFLFASLFMGEVFGFYERFWWWDIALHGLSAIGFGLIGFLFVFMLFEGDRFAAPPAALAFMAFCVAMTVGGTWEIFEFGMDQLFGLNMQKSGLMDTMGDLIVDMIGGIIGAVTGYLYLRGLERGALPRVLQQFITMNRRLYNKARRRN